MRSVAVRRGLAAVLALGALACGALALRTGEYPERDRTAPPLVTPVWSARRVPQPLVDGAGGQRLQVSLDTELSDTQACVAVADGDGLLAARDPDAALLPASTEKLLTALAAVEVLGTDYRFETSVVALGPVADGAVNRLWLVGAGDPVLATPEYAAFLATEPFTRTDVTTPLTALADAIVTQGIRQVTDGIVGDDSRYDDQRYLPTWRDSYRTGGVIGPLGALTVNDGFRAWDPDRVPVEDPALHAAGELGRLLRERGVEVGTPGHGAAPPEATPVAVVQSPPLHDIVSSLLRSSDNLTAELLTRELGLRVHEAGTTEAGTRAISETVADLGVPTNGVVLIDGSGLDRGDRATCSGLLAAVELGARPRHASVGEGLAVAGAESGTLAERLVGTPLDGRLRAKTGSLEGVTGLAGIVEVRRPLHFAFLAAGDFSEAAGIALRERIASIIGAYPDAPASDVLVPAPAAPR